MTIEDGNLSFGEPPEPPKTETVTDTAIDLLLALLAKGPRPSTELRAEIEAAGISWTTAVRAKQRLGIVAKRVDNRWYWSLPARESENSS